ncbi:MAG: zinc-ribbon domain-containing protein [Nitrososphaeraceae archaeon]
MLVFCSSCGKEASSDENFCPSCGKPMKSEQASSSHEMRRPTGITILGILQIISGIILAIAAAVFGALSGTMGDMMSGMMGEFMGALGGILAAVLGILAAISFLIAWALFSAKRWGRIIVIIFSIIDLVLEAVSIGGGNVFAIAGIILDIIILYYMWRPHVIAYFNK